MPENHKSLSVEHPDFEAQKEKYREWRAFCEGGDAIEGRTEYLKATRL
jgi:hypothetical protein